MAEIVDLVKYKEENSPHMAGGAVCLNCGHKWQAVAPVGVIDLDCPECTLHTGRYMNLVEDEGEHFTCHCGNQFFHITRKRIYCVCCGETVEPF